MATQQSADGISSEDWNLENTPTWAVALVCTVFVSVSMLFVLGIEKLESWLKRKRRKPLVHALEKLKEELLLLGFISLLLTVFQNYISGICVNTLVLQNWHPCNLKSKAALRGSAILGKGKRRLLETDLWPMIDWGNEPLFHGRMLSTQSATKTCPLGHSPLVSNETLAQLHTFIFILAGVHVVYSLFAMLLASTKVNGWGFWEGEAHQNTHHELREVVRSLSLHRQTTFIKYHTSKPWSRNRFFGWMVCFFRQFGKSVVRSDYLALRLGFIRNHNLGQNFDFHSYIIRSLEDEYQQVVGISASLWLFVILFMLFNVFGANLFFWLSFAPAVLVLLVGAKLQGVIATLALEIAGLTQNGLYAGSTVKPRDALFWFKKPQLILYLIHYIFFQNAFEMATFLSFTWQFGLNSCLLRDKAYVYTRIAMGVIVQVICSYITLPLYALVIQMGSTYKKAIFQEHVKEKLRHWRKGAKRRLKDGASAASSQDGSTNSRKRRSTDSGSPDEAGFETAYETRNDKRSLEISPQREPSEQSVTSPRDHHSSTLEISVGSENETKPFLISVSPPPSFTRAKSVPRIPTQPASKQLHKQFSSNPRAGWNVYFELDSSR